MKMCILCEDSKVDLVRERARKFFKNEKVLMTPVSKTGLNPITHWFCSLDVSERAYLKLIDIQIDSTMELMSKKDFLAKYELKVIK